MVLTFYWRNFLGEEEVADTSDREGKGDDLEEEDSQSPKENEPSTTAERNDEVLVCHH